MQEGHHLLAVTFWALKAATALCLAIVTLAAIGLAIIFASAANLDGNHLGISASVYGLARATFFKAGSVTLAGVLVCAALGLSAFRMTALIVGTAIAGDPFVNENARRLALVGWLLVAFIACQFATHLVIGWIVEKLTPAHHAAASILSNFSFGSGMSPVGFLAILLIFALSQIFHRGSDMRSELESTV